MKSTHKRNSLHTQMGNINAAQFSRSKLKRLVTLPQGCSDNINNNQSTFSNTYSSNNNNSHMERNSSNYVQTCTNTYWKQSTSLNGNTNESRRLFSSKKRSIMNETFTQSKTRNDSVNNCQSLSFGSPKTAKNILSSVNSHGKVNINCSTERSKYGKYASKIELTNNMSNRSHGKIIAYGWSNLRVQAQPQQSNPNFNNKNDSTSNQTYYSINLGGIKIFTIFQVQGQKLGNLGKGLHQQYQIELLGLLEDQTVVLEQPVVRSVLERAISRVVNGSPSRKIKTDTNNKQKIGKILSGLSVLSVIFRNKDEEVITISLGQLAVLYFNCNQELVCNGQVFSGKTVNNCNSLNKDTNRHGNIPNGGPMSFDNNISSIISNDSAKNLNNKKYNNYFRRNTYGCQTEKVYKNVKAKKYSLLSQKFSNYQFQAKNYQNMTKNNNNHNINQQNKKQIIVKKIKAQQIVWIGIFSGSIVRNSTKQFIKQVINKQFSMNSDTYHYNQIAKQSCNKIINKAGQNKSINGDMASILIFMHEYPFKKQTKTIKGLWEQAKLRNRMKAFQNQRLQSKPKLFKYIGNRRSFVKSTASGNPPKLQVQ